MIQYKFYRINLDEKYPGFATLILGWHSTNDSTFDTTMRQSFFNNNINNTRISIVVHTFYHSIFLNIFVPIIYRILKCSRFFCHFLWLLKDYNDLYHLTHDSRSYILAYSISFVLSFVVFQPTKVAINWRYLPTENKCIMKGKCTKYFFQNHWGKLTLVLWLQFHANFTLILTQCIKTVHVQTNTDIDMIERKLSQFQ